MILIIAFSLWVKIKMRRLRIQLLKIRTLTQCNCLHATVFHHYPLIFSLFLLACSNPRVTQSVPSFSSASSSLAPLSSFPPVPPLPPATRQPEAHLTSVREPGLSLTRPTSLPSAPEPGTGAGEDLPIFWSHQWLVAMSCLFLFLSCYPSMFFFLSALYFPSVLAKWMETSQIPCPSSTACPLS